MNGRPIPATCAAFALSLFVFACSSSGEAGGTETDEGTTGTDVSTSTSSGEKGSSSGAIDEGSSGAAVDESSGGESSTGGEPVVPPPLDLVPEDPPIDVPEGTTFVRDVPYGPDERNTADIFLPDVSGPTPMVIYIHGGGFTSGEKENAYQGNNADLIASLLEQGIAFATINYRLLDEVDDEGVIKSLGDSQRCLQFFRYHAEALNLASERVAAYGGSAGAGTSLWLGTHDDMAEPDSDDLIARQSTRLVAVGAIETQASYDLVFWETHVLDSYGLTLQTIAAAGYEQRILSFYGMDSLDQITDDPAIVAYRADLDMIALMDSEDAPVWVQSTNVPDALPTDTGALFHHPYHAREVIERAEEVGLESAAIIPEIDMVDADAPDLETFLVEHLLP